MQKVQKLNFKIFISALLMISISWFSCNKDSLIGSELLGKDGIAVEFTDTVKIDALIIKGADSLQTNGEGILTRRLFLGELDDPTFGFKKVDAYFQVGLGSTLPFFYDIDNKEFATLDSIVLIMNIDSSHFYGDKNSAHTVQVFKFDDEVENDIELYSIDEIPAMNAISAEQTISQVYENYVVAFDGDTSSTSPSIRIRLNDDFGDLIIQDTLALKQDTSFRKLFNGLKIVSSPQEPSLLALDIRVTSNTDIGNKMLLFYTDTIPKVYSFPIGGVRHNHIQKDITGSTIETAINNVVFADSIMFAEGFGGADIQIKFPTANYENFKDVFVKKAELELTLTDINDPYEPMAFHFVQNRDEDGEKDILKDILLASEAGQNSTFFGGNVLEEKDDNGVIVRKYVKLNITSYFLDLIAKDSDQINELFIGAAPTRLNPRRSTFYGPGHSTFPMKLKLTYSIPN